MHRRDLDRVEFYSREDLAAGYQLAKGEHVLRNDALQNYTDINDILELYNIKKYFDSELYLKSWSQEEISNFKQKVAEYGKIIGKFMSNVDDVNFHNLYKEISQGYINSFWELVSHQSVFKHISKIIFSAILSEEPHIIHIILNYESLVKYYDAEIKNFLLTYPKAAELLISIYEVKDDFNQKPKFVPKSLTIQNKESIISNYLDSSNTNLNYIKLIQNLRNRNDFKISDRTRLKAKRLHKREIEKIFSQKRGIEYGVFVSFSNDATKIKEKTTEQFTENYIYSVPYIKQNSSAYSLFQNFIILFEYLDSQGRINLVSKSSQITGMERILGIRSENEYRGGMAFNLAEMTSQAQIGTYSKIVAELDNSLENILHHVFTLSFYEKYDFANNAHFAVPTVTNSYFEKVRLLAPEFESILKQYKLFVEEGSIDFDLLQISSSPSTIKEIPSLNPNKYIYFNQENQEMVGCLNLFFSDQTILAYVDPFKEKQYSSFFSLLVNEQVKFDNYEEYQKIQINYLVTKNLISIDDNNHVQMSNILRVFVLKDLYDNEAASFYHYSAELKEEVQQMVTENILFYESSLFSKPEHAYFNYFLNKSEFTNGLDLRNSYLHGTQANLDQIQKHESAYFSYLKLIFLAMLKIEDDLFIMSSLKDEI